MCRQTARCSHEPKNKGDAQKMDRRIYRQQSDLITSFYLFIFFFKMWKVDRTWPFTYLMYSFNSSVNYLRTSANGRAAAQSETKL
jgi:hypothetical protein